MSPNCSYGSIFTPFFPQERRRRSFFLPEQLLPRDRTRQNIDFAYNWGARGENGMELVMEQEAPAGEVCLTPEAMDAYLDTLRQQGRSADTLAAYRRSIYGLYRSLPPDKRVGRGTLDRWRETLEDQGYLPRTINVRLAAANGLMTYLGHRELQATAALFW